MQTVMRNLWILPVSLCAAIGGEVAGESLPTLSIRYMTIRAHVILVGVPVDSKAGVLPTRYKVVDVLKGTSVKAGEKILIKSGRDYRLGPWPALKGKKGSLRITKALLFLKRPEDDAVQSGHRLVLSGIRAMAEDGQVLVPLQIMNPGPQILLPGEGEDWRAMLGQVRNDLPEIARALALGNIADRAKRNKAVFEWIERHKDGFGGGYLGRSKGWASLETQVFDWIMESCIPEDCWRAIELSVKLRTGPERDHPSFCSPGGRELLMARVFDDNLPEPLRRKALRELGSRHTFWYSHRSEYPGTRRVTSAERKAIIARILPLLDKQDAAWRREAVRCLMWASWPGDANLKHLRTKQAVPSLIGLYRTERNAGVRKNLVDAIRRLEDVAFWKKLSGNPHGIAALLEYRGSERGVLEFSLLLTHTTAKLTEMPALTFQKLFAHVPTRSVAASLRYPKDLFKRGWASGSGVVYVTIPASEVKPGLWRVTAEGRVGEAGETWRSEPIEITVPEPETPR